MASSPPNSSASSDSKPTPAAGCCDHLLASPCKPIHPNHTLDLDDSDEEYEHGVRVMNREEMSRYYQGFDVPTFPNTYALGLIVPISEEYLSKPYLRDCAEKAISHYNIQNANQQVVSGFFYYITFDVKQIGTEFPTTTFEAKVLDGIDDTKEVCVVCVIPYGTMVAL
ncbi:hypothetical protein SDJN03_00769, partial [Cucurbita argyrosperma subsp. sororia]